jgi:hypothetical protein
LSVFTFRAQVEWSTTAAAVARHAVDAWLTSVRCDETLQRDAVLIASELVTGVVNSCTGRPVLEAAFADHGVHLQVASTEVVGGADDLLAHGDLGSAVMDAVCDAWGVETTPTSTVVWAEKRS